MKPQNLRQLEIFIQLITSGSIANCARALALPALHVARELDALEAAVGHKLFVTNRGYIWLTAAGRMTVDAVASMSGTGPLPWDNMRTPPGPLQCDEIMALHDKMLARATDSDRSGSADPEGLPGVRQADVAETKTLSSQDRQAEVAALPLPVEMIQDQQIRKRSGTGQILTSFVANVARDALLGSHQATAAPPAIVPALPVATLASGMTRNFSKQHAALNHPDSQTGANFGDRANAGRPRREGDHAAVTLEEHARDNVVAFPRRAPLAELIPCTQDIPPEPAQHGSSPKNSEPDIAVNVTFAIPPPAVRPKFALRFGYQARSDREFTLRPSQPVPQVGPPPALTAPLKPIRLFAHPTIFGRFREALARFEKDHPNVKVDLTLHEGILFQPEHFFHRDVADIVFYYATGRAERFESEPVWRGKVTLHVGRGHPLARLRQVQASDLQLAQPILLSQKSALRPILENVMLRSGIDLSNPVLETDNIFKIMSAIRRGDGYFAAFGPLASDLTTMDGMVGLNLAGGLEDIEIRQARSANLSLEPLTSALADHLLPNLAVKS